ncbi:four-carbon acid sugar kinase family protein [Mesorhizobium sp. A623]
MTLTASCAVAGRGNPALLIVADDLTGAADCGVVCVKRGLDAVVVMAPDTLAEFVDVVAIDANTRVLHAEAAAEKTARILTAFGHKKRSLVFKKIDSTLRGHFGVELAAMLSARRGIVPDSVVVLAPAFPTLGRTTVDGNHLLWGRPLEESEPWRSEGKTGRAFLPQMVSDAGLRAELLPLDRVREGDDALLTTMKRLAARSDVIACDSETDDDLAALARASFQLGRETIWAGSAGLVGHLVDAAGLKRAQAEHMLAATVGAQVFVVGSRSAISWRQAAALAALDGVEVVDIDPTASAGDLDKVDFKGRFSAALETGKTVLIWQAGAEPSIETAKSRQCGDLATQIAHHKSRIGALFATGGETARCLLEALDVRALRLIDEIEPGVALSMAVGGGDLAMITKAGAFGNDATMAVCRAAFSHAATASRDVATDHRRVGV